MNYTKVSHLTDKFRGPGFNAVSVLETDTHPQTSFTARDRFSQ